MRRVVRRLLVVAVLVVAVLAAWFTLHAGSYLQHEDPLHHADAIFVLAGTTFGRPLEAVDLYKAGYAGIIALSPGNEDPANAIVRARGIAFPREVDSVRDALVRLGVPARAVIVGPGTMDNTAQEGLLLKTLAAAHGWHTIIVVTSKYHTRRSGFAMRRALAGTGISIIIRATKYDPADPAHWWRSRGDVRFVLSEWQKLIAYRFGLAG